MSGVGWRGLALSPPTYIIVGVAMLMALAQGQCLTAPYPAIPLSLQTAENIEAGVASLVNNLPDLDLTYATVGVLGPNLLWQKRVGAAQADTLFALGSATQIFTALLALDAVSSGRLASLDVPLNQLLPETAELYSDSVTLKSLAAFCSGLSRTAPCELDNCNVTTAEMLQRLRAQNDQLLFPPFFRTGYSDLGYDLLGHAVATLYNMSYEAAVQARILDPLQMSSTGFFPTSAQAASFANPGLPPAYGWRNPDGGLSTTAEDMRKFLFFLVSALSGEDTGVLSAAMLNQWYNPVVKVGNAKTAYGMPWVITNAAEASATWSYNVQGDHLGYSTGLRVVPEFGLAFVVLATTNGMYSAQELAFPALSITLFDDIIGLLVTQADGVIRAVPPGPLARFEGTFVGGPNVVGLTSIDLNSCPTGLCAWLYTQAKSDLAVFVHLAYQNPSNAANMTVFTMHTQTNSPVPCSVLSWLNIEGSVLTVSTTEPVTVRLPLVVPGVVFTYTPQTTESHVLRTVAITLLAIALTLFVSVTIVRYLYPERNITPLLGCPFLHKRKVLHHDADIAEASRRLTDSSADTDTDVDGDHHTYR